jgi:hypothetical protein
MITHFSLARLGSQRNVLGIIGQLAADWSKGSVKSCRGTPQCGVARLAQHRALA